MSAERPEVSNHQLPPAELFSPAICSEITRLEHQPRPELIPDAYKGLLAIHKHFTNLAERDENLEKQYMERMKRYFLHIAPFAGGAVVGELVDNQFLVGVSVIAAGVIVLKNIPSFFLAKRADPNTKKAVEYLDGALLRHPGRPISDI